MAQCSIALTCLLQQFQALFETGVSTDQVDVRVMGDGEKMCRYGR